nr:hypothetical protein [Klebsiella pneumoniae]
YLSSARDRDILRMRGDGMLTSKEAKNNANNHSLQACQSGTWGAPKIQFTTQTYNIAKNTRNLRLGVHAYCSWTYLNGSPFGGFQQVYSDQNNVWYVSNYAWGNYESGGTISVTCLNLPGAGA